MKIDRYTVQMLATKLDTNSCTLADAKKFVKTNFNISAKARTKNVFIREIAAMLAA